MAFFANALFHVTLGLALSERNRNIVKSTGPSAICLGWGHAARRHDAQACGNEFRDHRRIPALRRSPLMITTHRNKLKSQSLQHRRWHTSTNRRMLSIRSMSASRTTTIQRECSRHPFRLVTQANVFERATPTNRSLASASPGDAEEARQATARRTDAGRASTVRQCEDTKESRYRPT